MLLLIKAAKDAGLKVHWYLLRRHGSAGAMGATASGRTW
jgi:hypothetical protein